MKNQNPIGHIRKDKKPARDPINHPLTEAATRARENRWKKENNDPAPHDMETYKEYIKHDLDVFRKINQRDLY